MIWAGKRCVVDRPPLKSCPPKKEERRSSSDISYIFWERHFWNFVGNRSDVAKWSGSKSRTCVNDRWFPKLKFENNIHGRRTTFPSKCFLILVAVCPCAPYSYFRAMPRFLSFLLLKNRDNFLFSSSLSLTLVQNTEFPFTNWVFWALATFSRQIEIRHFSRHAFRPCWAKKTADSANFDAGTVSKLGIEAEVLVSDDKNKHKKDRSLEIRAPPFLNP